MRSTPTLALSALALSALAPIAAARTTVAEAQVSLKKHASDAEDDLENCMKQAFTKLKQAVKAIEDAVDQAEMSALEAVEAANAAASHYSTHLDEHANFVSAELCGKATALITELGKAPAGFLVGDCGTYDHFMSAVEATLADFAMKGTKRLKKLLKKLKPLIDAGGSVKISIGVQIVVTPPPMPAPGPVAPAPKELKITSASSAHDSKVANDGKLSIRGQAPAGGTVDVRIQGPGGIDITKTVPVNGDCEFQAGFPSAPGEGGDGNLPEGNYKVTVTAGNQTTVKWHGV